MIRYKNFYVGNYFNFSVCKKKELQNPRIGTSALEYVGLYSEEERLVRMQEEQEKLAKFDEIIYNFGELFLELTKQHDQYQEALQLLGGPTTSDLEENPN